MLRSELYQKCIKMQRISMNIVVCLTRGYVLQKQSKSVLQFLYVFWYSWRNGSLLSSDVISVQYSHDEMKKLCFYFMLKSSDTSIDIFIWAFFPIRIFLTGYLIWELWLCHLIFKCSTLYDIQLYHQIAKWLLESWSLNRQCTVDEDLIVTSK